MSDELKNELGWSHSRARLFRGCPRAYWFRYYGYWDAWKDGAPPEVRALWVERNLTSLPAWKGNVVHLVAKESIQRARRGRRVDVDAMRDWAWDRANRDIRGSVDGSWQVRPSKNVGFGEHYYREDVPESEWHAAVDDIDTLVVALFDHALFRRLLEAKDRVREADELRHFPFDGAKVFVALDAGVEDGKGGFVILDWKTGAHHDDGDIAAQLGVYGLYATRVLGYDASRIRAAHVNLRLDEVRWHDVGPAQIDTAVSTIQRDLAEMRGALRDVERNVAVAEDHPPLPEGSEACLRCVFRRSCGREAPTT